MSVIRVNTNFCQKLLGCRYLSNLPRHEEEYTSAPNYPPILDLSLEKRKERKKDSIYDEIKAVKTIEEKQIKLNMPKYYGFKSYMLLEDKCDYNNLHMTQHVTRTHLVTNKTLPDYYKELNVDELANKLKSEVEEALLVEIDGYQRLHDLRNEVLSKGEIEDITSSSLSKQINRIIVNELSSSHLKDIQIDTDPRIESTWYAGGIYPPDSVIKSKEGQKWMKEHAHDPWDRVIVYKGCPSLTVRSKLPLKSIVSHSEAENPDLDVPVFSYDPRSVGITTENRHIANIPGFWPGDPHTFGLLSHHKRGYMHLRERFGDSQDDKEAIHRQGILASFGWLQAQANYLGFNSFNDLTYPLVTQTVISNGKTWSFFTYQLNTIQFCERFFNDNPKKNICWATDEMNFFEEINNGKLVGFNDEVLKNLLKFYINQPESRLGINFAPYLSNEEKVCADYTDEDKRTWLEKNYKHLMSNRPRHQLGYEIYSWEKIYKIDNKTRFMDKKLRPFELLKHPYQRKLNERSPTYVPKKFRENVRKVKGGAHKFAKDYFP